MTRSDQIAFEKRLARYIADELAKSNPDRPPLFRLMAAHRAAENIVIRAKWAGVTLETLQNNLAKLQSTSWEI